MQSFKEIRFPEDISYGSSGGPNYQTDIITITNGFEQRNVNWLEARLKYNVMHGIRTQEQLDTLISFFRIVQGRAYAFRFKDWSDYKVTNQVIENNNHNHYQLYKIYKIGDYFQKRIIKKLLRGTVKIYLDKKLEDTDIDHDQGIVIFKNIIPKDVVITADFEFDVPVRFNTDSLSTIIDDYNSFSTYDIDLIEVKL